MTSMAEPEWDEQTRGLVLELDRLDMCPICHGPAELCQDPATQDEWDVPPPVRCHRTTAIQRVQKGMTEKTNPQLGALMWSAVLRSERG